jgi:hypothetical protein
VMRVQNRQEYDEAVGIVSWLRRKAYESDVRAASPRGVLRNFHEESHRLRALASGIEEEFLRPEATDVQSEPDSTNVPAEVHESGWQWRPTGDDAAFAPPFGTIRVCRACGCLVAGGPTACVRCVAASPGGLSQALHDLVKE